MPLEKSEIRVPFGGGLDTKTDHKQVIPGQLLELKNGVFSDLKQITKRNGFLAPWSILTVDGEALDSGNSIYRRGKELLVNGLQVQTVGRYSWEDGGMMFSHDPDDNNWKTLGTREPLSLDVETIYRPTEHWQIPDVALADSEKYAGYAWIDSDVAFPAPNGYAHASVIEVENDITVIDNWTYTGAATENPSGVHIIGLDVVGAFFNVWIAKASTNNIYMSIINTDLLSAAGAANLIFNDFNADGWWDVCPGHYGGAATPCSIVAYKLTVSGHTQVEWVLSNGGLAANATIAEISLDAICVFEAYDRLTATNKVIVVYKNAAGNIRGATFNVDGTVYAAPYTIINRNVGDVRNITGCKDTAADHYNWPARSYLRYYVEVGDNILPCDNTVLQAQCEFDNSNPLELNRMRKSCLASKAWEHWNKARVWVLHDSWGADLGTDPPGEYNHPRIQNTYFLKSTQGEDTGNQDGKDRTDARCLYQRGGDVSWYQSLSAVVSPETNKYIFAGFRRDVLIDPVTGGALKSIVGISTKFKEVAQPSTEMGPCIQTAGGFVGCLDGRMQELGFHLYPECVWHTETGGTTAVPAIWQYVVVYEWTDREGQLHQSAPSVPYDVSLANNDTQVTIWVACLHEGDYDRGEDIKCVLYRTVTGPGSIFYRLPETVHSMNDRTANYVAMIDPPSLDADITENAQLYTGTVITGAWDVVANICPPATQIMNVRQDRVMLVPDEDRTNIWFSKLKRQSVGVSFSDLFTKRITDGGDITALITMDNREIVFKASEIRAFSGSGPNDLGQGEFSEDYMITSDVGCVDRASVVWTDKGIMFKSNKGIYLLGRNLQVSYVGAPVEAYNNYKVLKATLVEDKNQVRFLLEEQSMLVYDYFVNQWSVFEAHQAGETFDAWDTVDSCIWQDNYVMIQDGGLVYREGSTWVDTISNYIPLDLTTSWIKLTGLQGYQRVWWISLLGEIYTQCTINYEIYYDYVDANPQTGSIVVDAAFAADPPAQFRVKPRYGSGKCQAFKIRLYDEQAEAPAGTQKGYSISDIMVQIGKKPGVMRQGTLKTR